MKIGRPFGLYCNFHSHRYANLALIIYLGVSKLSETTGTSKKIFLKNIIRRMPKLRFPICRRTLLEIFPSLTFTLLVIIVIETKQHITKNKSGRRIF